MIELLILLYCRLVFTSFVAVVQCLRSDAMIPSLILVAFYYLLNNKPLYFCRVYFCRVLQTAEYRSDTYPNLSLLEVFFYVGCA